MTLSMVNFSGKKRLFFRHPVGSHEKRKYIDNTFTYIHVTPISIGKFNLPRLKSGSNAMTTLLGDWHQFSAKKLAFFMKLIVIVDFLHKLPVQLWVKTPFVPNFRQKMAFFMKFIVMVDFCINYEYNFW
jgi:hypothetical protein